MTLRSSVYGWKSVWIDLAEEAGGEFSDGKVVAVRIPLKPLTLTFQMQGSQLATRGENTAVYLPYRGAGDFKFAIHNQRWVDGAAKTLGLQDIIVGFDEFDKEHIIQGNNEFKVKEYFADEQLRKLIHQQKSVRLALHKDGHLPGFGKIPGHVHVLTFEERSAINSFERLVSLVDLMKHAFHKLVELKVASVEDPDFVI